MLVHWPVGAPWLSALAGLRRLSGYGLVRNPAHCPSLEGHRLLLRGVERPCLYVAQPGPLGPFEASALLFCVLY